jgi:dTMP kinase
LQVPVAVGAARRDVTGSQPDRFESASGGFHARVLEGFLALAAEDPETWVVIDGTCGVDVVERLVLDAVDRKLGR